MVAHVMKNIIVGLVLITMMVSCGLSDNPIQQRAKQARKAKGDVMIGAVAPWGSSCHTLWQGIEMAVEEINTGGKILNRKIRIVKRDDKASVNEGQIIAQQFVENLDMVAVVGHYDSYISNSISIIYEYYGLLMLTPSSTSPRLTRQGFKRVFRSIPNDELFGMELAIFCQKMGFRQMMICQKKDDYGEGIANAFDSQCIKSGITILDRLSYDFLSASRHLEQDFTNWNRNFTFDAIFLAGAVLEDTVIVKEIRKTGIMVPIVSGDGLDNPDLIQAVGKAAESVFVGSIFHHDNPREEVQAFVKTYYERYSEVPDAQAAQGYDAIKLLAYAMEQAGTTVPDELAEALRSTKNFNGVTGKYAFEQNGDLVERSILVKMVSNGRFKLIQK
jgi:branched-chain amino acid transport system substrate-binding protein